MNVHDILELMSRRLPESGVNYLLIGGYAVNKTQMESLKK